MGQAPETGHAARLPELIAAAEAELVPLAAVLEGAAYVEDENAATTAQRAYEALADAIRAHQVKGLPHLDLARIVYPGSTRTNEQLAVTWIREAVADADRRRRPGAHRVEPHHRPRPDL